MRTPRHRGVEPLRHVLKVVQFLGAQLGDVNPGSKAPGPDLLGQHWPADFSVLCKLAAANPLWPLSTEMWLVQLKN